MPDSRSDGRVDLDGNDAADKKNYLLRVIGVTGLEPATSWSQTKRSSQAELHPVNCKGAFYPILDFSARRAAAENKN